MIRTLADGLLAVAVAPACAACRHHLDSPTESAVCGDCWRGIRPLSAPFCTVCNDPLPTWRSVGGLDERCPRCRESRAHISRGRTIGAYDGPLRAILHALKYDGRTSLAEPLAALMRVEGHAILEGADFAVPVPLHWRRRWKRGFNQAEALAARLGVPLLHALSRCRHTPSQTDLPADERYANVREAFRLRRGLDVTGCCVVVVDDVSTTGATLEACAKVLATAGATDVRTLTAARVVTTLPAARPPSRRHEADRRL